jgi:hypothetical protein
MKTEECRHDFSGIPGSVSFWQPGISQMPKGLTMNFVCEVCHKKKTAFFILHSEQENE